ncbi:MAG: aminotransferase class IV [Prolixibacteraceae bacterium]
MYRLIESIRIENKQLQHIDLHNKRFNTARKSLFGLLREVNLIDHIQLPNHLTDQRYKCRITTSDGIKVEHEIRPYVQRKVESLKLVTLDTIDYSIKTDQRELLDDAYAKRGACDDVIIIKNNLLTDSWAANILLFDGEKWVTPDTPLLNGIQREHLLRMKQISLQRISIEDLKKFKKVKLINAMLDFDRAPEIPIHQIFS